MTVKLKYIVEFYVTVVVPLIYLIGLYAATLAGTLSIPQELRIISLVCVAIGLTLWIMSYIDLSNSFGVLPKSQLRVKRGVYSVFRHPMYVGIIITYLSLSIANESKPGVLYTLVILLPLLVIRVYFEEKLLIDN